MPLFDVGSPAYQTTSVGTATAVKIFSGTASSSLSGTLQNVVIVNTGTCSLMVGGGSMAAIVTAGTYQPSQIAPLLIPPGAVLTIQGWQETAQTTTWDIYGLGLAAGTGTGMLPGATTVVAGLATVASVV